MYCLYICMQAEKFHSSSLTLVLFTVLTLVTDVNCYMICEQRETFPGRTIPIYGTYFSRAGLYVSTLFTMTTHNY